MPITKRMHPRNIYIEPPDFKELAISYPNFRKYVKQELNGRLNIDYSDPNAIKALTRVLLKKDFNLDVDICESRLIPRVPVCLNYILWVEDLLVTLNENKSEAFGIDIGTGSVGIYSLLAARKGWKMLATEMDEVNYKNAENNVKKNNLENVISLKLVSDSNQLLQGVIDEHTQYDFCMCNPPFFDFDEKPLNRTSRRRMLDTVASEIPTEISTEGGEIAFLTKLIQESEKLQGQVKIYTTLVGKKADYIYLKKELRKYSARSVASTEFSQGRTMRWALAWTYLNVHLKISSGPSKIKSKKSKSKPPFQIVLPGMKKENLDVVVKTTKTVLTSLMFKFSEEMSHPKVVIYFKAYKNTWGHQRQKRRLEARINANKAKNNSKNDEEDKDHDESDNEEDKDNDESDNEECSEPKRQKLETNELIETDSNDEPIVEGSMIFNTEQPSIILEIIWISGNKCSYYQICQYFKNYWNRVLL